MAHRNDYELYLLSVKYRGQIMSSTDLLKKFGYSKNTNPIETRLYKRYIQIHSYQHPSQYWKIKSVVAVTDNILETYADKMTISKGVYRVRGLVDGQILYLIDRDLIPFWLLEEYGGNIK